MQGPHHEGPDITSIKRGRTFEVESVPIALRGLVVLFGHAVATCSGRRPGQLVAALIRHEGPSQRLVFNDKLCI